MLIARSFLVVALAGISVASLLNASVLVAVEQDPNAKANYGEVRPVLSVTSGGKLYCGLPEETRRTDLSGSDNFLNANLVLHLDTFRDGQIKIDIHKRILTEEIFGDVTAGGVVRGEQGLYFRYSGNEISSKNDAIVFNFERNTSAESPTQELAPKVAPSKFFGFKFLVGRSREQGRNGIEHKRDVYLRVVINGAYKGIYRRTMTSHRAAYVVSNMVTRRGDKPTEEKFYRFFPSGRPFWMIACVLDDGAVI